jgi:hypothetical protein
VISSSVLLRYRDDTADVRPISWAIVSRLDYTSIRDGLDIMLHVWWRGRFARAAGSFMLECSVALTVQAGTAAIENSAAADDGCLMLPCLPSCKYKQGSHHALDLRRSVLHHLLVRVAR